jgi:hypothetical protein
MPKRGKGLWQGSRNIRKPSDLGKRSDFDRDKKYFHSAGEVIPYICGDRSLGFVRIAWIVRATLNQTI